MEKYKYPVFDPETMNEPEFRETVFSNDLVMTLHKSIKGIENEKVHITEVQVMGESSISWGIVEEIDGKKYLTHRVFLKKA